MSSPIKHEPVAARQPVSTLQSIDRLSSILGGRQEEPRQETAQEEDATEYEDQPEESVDETEHGESHEAEDEPSESVKAENHQDTASEETGEEAEEIALQPTELAALLGVDERDVVVSDDGSVSINVKTDDGIQSMGLREIRDGYRLAKISDQRINKLGEERKAFETERQTALQTLADQQQTLQYALAALEEDYKADFKSIDWDSLRNDDPTEYNLRRTDYEDRRRKVEAYRDSLKSAMQHLHAEQMQELQKRQQDGARMLQDVFTGESYRTAPEWNQTEKKRLRDWIASQGFNDQDINSVGVWQVFKWARDSMLREAELASAKEAVKKVVKLPKVMKPGKPKTKEAVKKGKIDALKSRQRKSGGSMGASVDLIRGILDRQE